MRTRITIQTTEELDQALEQIRMATGRQTKSDVIRDSIELYDLVVQHLCAGKHLYLGITKDSAGEVLLPHLERAANRLRPQLAALASDASVPYAIPATATQTHRAMEKASGTAQRPANKRR